MIPEQRHRMIFYPVNRPEMIQHWPCVWEEHKVGTLGAGDLHHACWQACHTLSRVQVIVLILIVIILVVVVQLVCIQIATSATGSAGSNLTPEHHVLVVVDIVHGQPVPGHLQPAK